MKIKVISDRMFNELDLGGYTVLVLESALEAMEKEDADKIRALDGKVVDDNVYYNDEPDFFLDLVDDADRAELRFGDFLYGDE